MGSAKIVNKTLQPIATEFKRVVVGSWFTSLKNSKHIFIRTNDWVSATGCKHNCINMDGVSTYFAPESEVIGLDVEINYRCQ